MILKQINLIDKKMIVLLIIMLIISPTLGGKNTYTICLIYSHYLTMYMNNIYLLMVYQYASKINTLLPYIITRTNQDYFYTNSYFSLLIINILYQCWIYISYYFFFGAIPQDSLSLTIVFMIMNMIIGCIESTIIYLQIGQKKNFIYLAFPILINVLFHMIFTQLF